MYFRLFSYFTITKDFRYLRRGLVKLARLILHSQLEYHALPLLEGTDKGVGTQKSLLYFPLSL